MPAPLEHAHAVRHLGLLLRGRCNVHRLAVSRAAQVCEAGTRDVDAMRVARAVDRSQQLPIRLAVIDCVVAQDFASRQTGGEFGKAGASQRALSRQRKTKSRLHAAEQDPAHEQPLRAAEFILNLNQLQINSLSTR